MKAILILALAMPLAAQAPTANIPPLPVTATVQIKPCTIPKNGGTCPGYTAAVTGTTKATVAPVTLPATVFIMLTCNPAALTNKPPATTITIAGLKCTVTKVTQ